MYIPYRVVDEPSLGCKTNNTFSFTNTWLIQTRLVKDFSGLYKVAKKERYSSAVMNSLVASLAVFALVHHAAAPEKYINIQSNTTESKAY